MKLRWKKNSEPTGLARICSGPVGGKYYDGVNKYASVNASRNGLSGPVDGWYYVCSTFEKDDNVIIPYINTCDNLCETVEDAKKLAVEYVKKHLKKAGLI